ncbi:MAG: hypothetical protein ABIH59_03745 [archaeon]
MKRYFILIFIILALLGISIINNITMTGKVTSQTVKMNITVTIGTPTLTILSPENTTYTTNTSILLNYTSNTNNIRYNLDNSTNTTITSPTYFNTTEGGHTLYIYANNSNGTISKNITFTINSTEATPLPPSSSTSSSGSTSSGGKVSGKTIEKTQAKGFFEISQEELKIKLKQGEIKSQKIIIKNIKEKALSFKISISKIKDFLRINEEEFKLEPKEEKVIIFDFIAKEDITPTLYMGEIIIKTDEEEEKILVLVEIETKKSLFDVKMNLLKTTVIPGETINPKIELYNLGETGRIDASIEYFIKNEYDEIIVYEQETVAVETQLSYIKELQIPETANRGRYVLYVKVSYSDTVASSTVWFSLDKKLFSELYKILDYALILGIVAVLIFILYEIKKLKNMKKKIKKYEEKNSYINKKKPDKKNKQKQPNKISEKKDLNKLIHSMKEE